MLTDLNQEAAQVGLKLHLGKTKIQNNSIGYGVGVKNAKCGDITVEILSRENHTMYLGRAINLTNMEDEELNSRVAEAWAKFGVFRQELLDRSVPVHLRIQLFDTVVTPTMLYGSEAWSMTQKRQMKLRPTQRRMFRSLLHCHRT